MDRHVRTLPAAILAALLPIAYASAQTPDTEETVSVTVFSPDGSTAKTSACPSGVPVDTRAVEFKGTVTTTSESGVTYQVLIRYGSGAAPGASGGTLRHENLETSHSPWNVSTEGSETVLELNATVVSGAPLSWRAELWGDAPGTVHHLWQTRLNGNLGQNESCVYDIVGTPDLAVSISRMHPNYVNSETDGFQVPLEEAMTYVVEIENVGNFDAPVYTVGGGFASEGGTTGGPQLVGVQSVEPSHGAALECQVLSTQDGFACAGSALAPGQSVDVTVVAAALMTGSGIFSVSGSAPQEENLENNIDVVGLEIIPRTGFGHIHIPKRVRVGGGGIGSGLEVPVDGVRFELLNENEDLLAFADSGPMDIDESGDIDPDTERGMVWFKNLPPRDYIVREVVEENMIPFDPLGGSIVVVVNPGDNLVIGFTQDGKYGLDWGDLPEPYDPLNGQCPLTTCFRTRGTRGASHVLSVDIGIGEEVDAEVNGRPRFFATGDDNNDDEDEDGVFFDSLLAGSEGQITIDVYDDRDARPHVVGWIDFDDNGMFSYGERIIDERRGDGLQTFTFPIPAGANLRYGRFRVARSFPDRLMDPQDQNKEDPASWGHYAKGEVEDYYIPDISSDFGDAPETMDPDRPDIPWGYPTTRESDGAAHITIDVSDFRIGDRVDGDPVAQESIEANGDDNHNLYDEDGIRFSTGFLPFITEVEPRSPTGVRTTFAFTPGTSVTVVPLANRDGKLDAWFDFNRNGSWEDPGEKVIDSASVQSGPFFTPITFEVPQSADPGWTFARFRFSMEGGLEAFGQIEGGEVEDYLLRILPSAMGITTLEDGGPGSIRQLIEAANDEPGTDPIHIYFDAEAVGKTTEVILLQSPLPTVERPVVISGGGSLVLDGSQAGDNANGLILSGGSSTVHGLTIQNFSNHGIALNSDDNVLLENLLTANGGDGVHAGSTTGNRILSNRIFDNGSLAIDYGDEGPTPNDDGDQDGVPNHPVLNPIRETTTALQGSITSSPETTFLIQVFSSPTCSGAGIGGDAALLGSAQAVTDETGIGEFEVTLDSPLPKEIAAVATATGPNGTSEFSECGIVTPIEADPIEVAPSSFDLGVNYPNPLASETTIPFDIPTPGKVRVEIFNGLGQIVVVPVDGSLAPGRYRINVNAGHLPSGVYFYRMSTDQGSFTRKMVIVR